MRRCMCGLADPVFARVGGNDLHANIHLYVYIYMYCLADSVFARVGGNSMHEVFCFNLFSDVENFSALFFPCMLTTTF